MGVDSVIIGSVAVKKPELVESFIREFSPSKIIIGVDVLDGIPKITGWTEWMTVTAEELIEEMIELGVKTINYTDINKDGTLTSPNFGAYEKLVKKYPSLKMQL